MEQWTPNQLVAYNLKKAREVRGWTQERAAAEVAAIHKAAGWTKATWSAAERSVDGKRIRHFSADDLLAFSLAFKLPIGWWLLQPDDVEVQIGAPAAPGSQAFVSFIWDDGTLPPPMTISPGQAEVVRYLTRTSQEVEKRLERIGAGEYSTRVAEEQGTGSRLLRLRTALREAADLLERQAADLLDGAAGFRDPVTSAAESANEKPAYRRRQTREEPK